MASNIPGAHCAELPEKCGAVPLSPACSLAQPAPQVPCTPQQQKRQWHHHHLNNNNNNSSSKEVLDETTVFTPATTTTTPASTTPNDKLSSEDDSKTISRSTKFNRVGSSIAMISSESEEDKSEGVFHAAAAETTEAGGTALLPPGSPEAFLEGEVCTPSPEALLDGRGVTSDVTDPTVAAARLVDPTFLPEEGTEGSGAGELRDDIIESDPDAEGVAEGGGLAGTDVLRISDGGGRSGEALSAVGQPAVGGVEGEQREGLVEDGAVAVGENAGDDQGAIAAGVGADAVVGGTGADEVAAATEKGDAVAAGVEEGVGAAAKEGAEATATGEAVAASGDEATESDAPAPVSADVAAVAAGAEEAEAAEPNTSTEAATAAVTAAGAGAAARQEEEDELASLPSVDGSVEEDADPAGVVGSVLRSAAAGLGHESEIFPRGSHNTDVDDSDKLAKAEERKGGREEGEGLYGSALEDQGKEGRVGVGADNTCKQRPRLGEEGGINGGEIPAVRERVGEGGEEKGGYEDEGVATAHVSDGSEERRGVGGERKENEEKQQEEEVVVVPSAKELAEKFLEVVVSDGRSCNMMGLLRLLEMMP